MRKKFFIIFSLISLISVARYEAFVATTSEYGQLKDLIGDRAYAIDSLVVIGPIDASDFETIWDCSFYGDLQALNLENASVKDDKIPDFAFYHEEVQMIDPLDFYTVKLRQVILPTDITEIGVGAFRCTCIETIQLPSTLRKLGRNCFYLCQFLDPKPLVIPEWVEEIPEHCFRCCFSLTEVRLPNSLKRIGYSAFQGSFDMYCNFPENLESIGGFAFYDVQGLTSVVLPSKCLTLEESAFDGCMNLEYMELPYGLESIPDFFLNSSLKLKELEIPETVKIIGDNAFAQSGIKSFIIPEGVEYIGEQAFAHCDADSLVLPSTLAYLGGQSCRFFKVGKIYSKATEPAYCGTFIDEGPFKPNAAPLYVPAGTAERYRNSYGWNVLTDIVEVDYGHSYISVIREDKEVFDEGNAIEGAGTNIIFNTQGIRLLNEPQSGLYIKNGKKYFKP